ncbi:membrane protein [Amycolatopsis sp. MJM2582]|uniref:DUF4383 domain-containing protein n=1 Tax=Amycolatopsis sp. MJM2582 TaxID=1427749 RepID=UPI0005000BD9|nr:DUF4383 domain-containing protein [Amycolatopsis sp. MJM2582]KFZ81793.1 membrane protein [Amycolatopsis sp. MJM2582]
MEREDTARDSRPAEQRKSFKRGDARRPPQVAALVVGAAFLLVGVLGFIPGITTGYDGLEFAGHHAGARLFGVFAVSILHNLVHLLFGVVGVLAARKRAASRVFLMVGGGIYLLLWIVGLAIPQSSPGNFLPFNVADNWLHLGLGVGMMALGVFTTALERKAGDYPEPDLQHQ